MALLSGRYRISGSEMIDRPETSAKDIGDNLRDLAAINRWLGGAQATLAHAEPILRACPSDPVRILDAACGGGDVSRYIVDAARGIGRHVEVIGLDISEKVLAWAREMSSGYPEIAFVHADALAPPFRPGDFDLVILTTFVHHLEPEQVVTALRAAGEMSRGHVIVSDLVRSPWAHLGYCILSRAARFCPVSIHDGAVSVRRAYIPSELAELASQSGVRNWKVYRHRLYRMTLVYEGGNLGDKGILTHG